jgi:uncharacterized membrane protein YebE (DUF533 family)
MNMIKKEDIMELIDLSKLTSLLDKVRGTEIVVTEKKSFDWKKLFAVIGVIAAVAGIAYAVYRYFSKDYEDEFLDDFDDDEDEDDLFEDKDVEDLEEE